MQKLWTITTNDLRTIFADRGIWINLIIVPVALAVVVGLANGAFAGGGADDDGETRLQRYRIDVINQDGGDLTAALMTTLTDNQQLIVCTPETPTDNDECNLSGALTEDRVGQRIETNTTQALVMIPSGFTAAAQAGEPARLIYRSDDELNQTSPALTLVQNALQQISGQVVARRVSEQVAEELTDVTLNSGEMRLIPFRNAETRATFNDDVAERAASLWENNPVNVEYALAAPNTDTDDEPSGQSGFAQSVPGMASMYVMFNVLAGMVSLIQERKQWTLQRLATLPVAKWQILGGKMFARFLLGMIQFVVVFVAGYALGLRYSNLLGLLALMVSFVAVIVAITFLLATVIGNEQQASAVSLFLALTLAPIGGAWWPLEIVPPFMKQLAYLTPVGWVMRGFNDLMLYGADLSAVLLPVGILIGAAVIFFGGAVARFRYT